MEQRRMPAEQPRTAVATCVEPSVRPTVEAAAGGLAALHAQSMTEILAAVRERPVAAVLISPAWIQSAEISRVAALTRSFPSLPAVAVLTRLDGDAGERLLHLGASGVRSILDVSSREGWQRLRQMVSESRTPYVRRFIDIAVEASGPQSTAEYRRFLETLIRVSPAITTVRQLCESLEVQSSTFMSRFFRAGLPSPKRHLAAARLVHAAGMLSEPGRRLGDVAYQLDYSSPQSFSRHVKAVLGMTASDFRRKYGFEHALEDFCVHFITPYRSRLREFHPLEPGMTPGQAKRSPAGRA